MDIQQSLIEAILRADRPGANALIDGWVAEHGTQRLLVDLLDPMLSHIGDEWQGGAAATLAQAYVAARVAEDALARIAAQAQPTPSIEATKGPVVIGNIEDDFHALGRKMVGTFLRADGWIVHDLGNDVLPATFVDKALEVGARVIGVSAMMLTTARNIRRLREEIDRRGLTGRLQLAVGGAVFRVCPGLDREVGGDGTAGSALDAPALFATLWQKAVPPEAKP
jgi:methanogenic corrinoid protein MtbC1